MKFLGVTDCFFQWHVTKMDEIRNNSKILYARIFNYFTDTCNKVCFIVTVSQSRDHRWPRPFFHCQRQWIIQTECDVGCMRQTPINNEYIATLEPSLVDVPLTVMVNKRPKVEVYLQDPYISVSTVLPSKYVIKDRQNKYILTHIHTSTHL